MEDNPEIREQRERRSAFKITKDMNAFIASFQFAVMQLRVMHMSRSVQLYGHISGIYGQTRKSLLFRGGMTLRLLNGFFAYMHPSFVFAKKIRFIMRVLSQGNKSPKPRCVATLTDHSNWVTSATFNPSGTLLATVSDKTAKLWRFKDTPWSATCVATLEGHDRSISSVAFHPSMPYLLTGSEDGTANVWNLLSNGSNSVCINTVFTYDKQKKFPLIHSVNAVAFHPKETLLAIGSSNMTAILWRFSPDGKDLTCVATLEGHSNWVNSIAFNPAGTILASGSKDGTAKLWNILLDGKDPTCVATLKGHSNSVTSIAFNPAGTILATGSDDNTVKLWPLSPNGTVETCVATLEGHSNRVASVAFNPAGTILATGSDDNTVKLWRLSPDGTVVICVATLNETSYTDSFVAFHPKWLLLATGSENPYEVALRALFM